MTKSFLIYYSRGDDPLARVRSIRRRANGRAADIGKSLEVHQVDVKTASAERLRHWKSRRTIDCVTVRGDDRVDHAISPSGARIDELVDGV